MPGTPPVLVKFAYTRTYRDRHGKLRIEYRRSGKVTPLRGTPGTLEFQEAYDAARGLYERPGEGQQTKAGKVGSGTLRWLCVEYFKSAEFSQLAPSTQRARRQIFEGILLETISPKSSLLFADCPTGKFGQQHVRVLRDRKKAFPEAANIRLKVLRGLFNWATENATMGITRNPAREVAKLKVREDGYHVWTDRERTLFEERHPIGTKARLAYASLSYWATSIGRRAFRSPAYAERQFALHATENRRRKPISLELPVLPELQRILNASPVGDLTFLVTEHGKPFAVAGFGNWFRDKCNEAGLAGCTAHGLRKAAATVAAENGATAHQLMAIFGWLSLKEAERYTRTAEKKKLAEAGMGLLVPLKARTESV